MPAAVRARIGRWTSVVGLAAALALRLGPAEAAAPVFGAAAPLTVDTATDTGNDSTPRIVTDGHGTWITIWAATSGIGGALGTDSDVVVARSQGLGVTWTAPLAVNANAKTDDAFDFAPALATDGHGLWIAVWVATNGLDTDIFAARSTNGGASWSAPQPIHLDAASDGANDDHPQIATNGTGTWVVVWDANARTGTDRDVFAARSVDGGFTWSAPAALAATAATDRGTDQRPQLATDGEGRWLVVWASNDTLGGTTGNDFDVLVARSTDGAATWTPAGALNTNATTDRGLDDRPQIATDGTGTWVAAWVSDENLGGLLGTDLDVLTARSTDGGVTWSAPAALNANAATDAGEDGGPTLTVDGAGTWVAAWESTDTLGGTIGDDFDILMAHSIDGGAHWSTPHALDPGAASDGRRDVTPQLAAAGGVWNAVWVGSGAALGNDRDVLRAGGRERCGNGSVDPGEECDDGNTRGGDACPASCEYPPPPPTPVATGAPGGGTSSPGEGATPTPGEGSEATPGDDTSDTPTPNGDATPTAASGDTPSGAPTPSADAGATPSATATAGEIDPLATATADAAGPSPTPTASRAPGASTNGTSHATPTTATGTPRPAPTSFAGGLAGAPRAKAAVACQRAVLKVGSQLVATRLSNLGSCGRAVQRCLQTKPDDPACIDKAALRCRSALAGFAKADAKHAAALRKRCGGTLALADVLAPAGLGFGVLACGDEGVARDLEDLIDCVVGEHGCRAAALFEILQPRAKELLRVPGMNAATLDSVVCLPDHGGDGAVVGDPAGQGKAVDACASAIVKAGTSYVRKRLARLTKCADGLFACVQLAPDDGACLAKARTRCDQGEAASAADERKLGSAVGGRCAENVVAYATLRAARAANLDALAAACTGVGVPQLVSLADYQQCVLRAEACRLDGVLTVQAPRIAELLAVVGRSFARPYCGVP